MPIRFEDSHGRAIQPGESRQLQTKGDGGNGPVPMVAHRDCLDARGRMVHRGDQFDATNEGEARQLERSGLASRVAAVDIPEASMAEAGSDLPDGAEVHAFGADASAAAPDTATDPPRRPRGRPRKHPRE